MSRFLLAAVAPLVALAAGAADPPGPWANKLFAPAAADHPERPAPPVVVHDFGTVPHGTLCAHTFTLTNIYDVPIQVLDIRRSCGCLEAYPPQRVLLPREAAGFTVTMNAGKFTGPNAQTVEVEVGGRNFRSAAVLRLQATSRADVQVSPGQVNFGTVSPAGRAAQTVTLEYAGRQKDWAVVGAVPAVGPLTVDVREVARSRGGVRYAVTVGLKPDAPAGPVGEVVSLRTNDPTAPVVQLPVAGLVQAALTVSPGAVNFGRVRVGEPAVVRVLVRAAGPFRVLNISGEGDGVTAEPFPAAGPSQMLTFKFQPARPGPIRKEVRLTTDLGSVAIPVEGEGVE